MSPEPSSLPRVLGIGGVAFASFNCIVGGGIFGLQALAAAALGAAAVLGYLVCTVLLGLVALCFAEIGSRVTEAGGPFAYATVPFGSVVGGVVVGPLGGVGWEAPPVPEVSPVWAVSRLTLEEPSARA